MKAVSAFFDFALAGLQAEGRPNFLTRGQGSAEGQATFPHFARAVRRYTAGDPDDTAPAPRLAESQAMPTERRMIRFSTSEVEEALRRFAEDQQRALPSSQVTAVEYDKETDEGVGARVRFENVPRPTHFTPLEMAAALIAYCRRVRVPIPKQGQKSLHMTKAGLTLQIDVKPK
jgi:hypothetical protein